MRKNLKENRMEEEKRKRNRTIQLLLWTGLVLVQMMAVQKLDVHAMARQEEGRLEEGSGQAVTSGAADALEDEEERITVWSDSFDRQENCPVPESIYTAGEGDMYRLLSWEEEPVQVPARSYPVEREEIIGPAEGISRLPESIVTEVEEAGRTIKVSCHLKEKTVIREEWQDGFQFPVVFHGYEAGHYWLGDRLISGDGEKPCLDGCEELLLKEIGLSGEDYRIEDVRWDGEAYVDEEGQLCRNGTAFGQKRIRDYRAIYVGTAELPAYCRWRTKAVYEPVRKEAMQETEGESEPVLVELEETRPAAAAIEEPLTMWERIKRTLLVTIAIGALLFFGGLVSLGIVWVVRLFMPYRKGQRRRQ